MNLGNCPVCDGNAWEVVDESVVCGDCYTTVNHPEIVDIEV